MTRHGLPVLDRALLHINQNAPGGCWVWTGALSGGYGMIRVDGRSRYVHRLLYEELVGPIPDGMQIDHLCRIRSRCNPAHLEPVTPLENSRRSPIHHGAKTHCPQNHPYDEENTYVTGGRRFCRQCQRAASAAWKARGGRNLGQIANVKARKDYACDTTGDTSWARACRPIRRGDNYLRVVLFPATTYYQGKLPRVVHICSECAVGYSLPEDLGILAELQQERAA